MNTDGNMAAIERHLADCEEHDAWQDLQDQLEAARADAKEAEAYAEELEKELNTCRMAQAVMDNTVADLEAKLTKTVEALEQIAQPKVGPDFDWTEDETNKWRAVWYRKYQDIARATLAEIKSSKAAPPYGLEGESHD